MLYRCGNIIVPESNIAKIEVVNSDLVIYLLSQERPISVGGDDAKAILARVVPLPTSYGACITEVVSSQLQPKIRPEFQSVVVPLSEAKPNKGRGKISQLV